MSKKMVDIPVYCINLKTSVERRHLMERQFIYHNMKYNFVEAVIGKNLKKQYKKCRGSGGSGLKYKNMIEVDQKYMDGMRGSEKNMFACILSHIKAITQAYNDGCERAIVMEDDISFEYHDKWRLSVNEILDQAPSGWQIVRLHCSNHKAIVKLNKSTSDYVQSDQTFWSAGFYALNREGMKFVMNKFIKIIKKDEVHVVVGDSYAADRLMFYFQPPKKVFVYKIPIVINNNLSSDVPSDLSTEKWRRNYEREGIILIEHFYRACFQNVYMENIHSKFKTMFHGFNTKILIVHTLDAIEELPKFVVAENFSKRYKVDYNIIKRNSLSLFLYIKVLTLDIESIPQVQFEFEFVPNEQPVVADKEDITKKQFVPAKISLPTMNRSNDDMMSDQIVFDGLFNSVDNSSLKQNISFIITENDVAVEEVAEKEDVSVEKEISEKVEELIKKVINDNVTASIVK